jgi:hypothetical protein
MYAYRHQTISSMIQKDLVLVVCVAVLLMRCAEQVCCSVHSTARYSLIKKALDLFKMSVLCSAVSYSPKTAKTSL